MSRVLVQRSSYRCRVIPGNPVRTGVETLRGGERTVGPDAARPGRLTSLDWVRGWFLVASVGTAAVLSPRPDQLRHAAWFGVTALDVIFPLFVTLSGCGLAFAYRNRVGWRATLRRSIVLLLVGLGYNAVLAGSLDLATLRLTGPLQVYAVLVLVIGLLHLRWRTTGAWVAVTAVTAAAHLTLLATWQVGCPGGDLAPTCNPSGVVDRAVLGSSHVYALGSAGYDPEGLVAILGALVTASAGVSAGHLLLAPRRSPRRAVSGLVAWAAVLVAAGWLATPVVPAMKRLWTPGFGLGVAAAGVVALAVGFVLLDLPASPSWQRWRQRLAWPHVAMGRNSLLVYFGSHIAVGLLVLRGGDPSFAEQLAASMNVLGHPRATFVAANIALWAAIAAVLHRRGIYLRP